MAGYDKNLMTTCREAADRLTQAYLEAVDMENPPTPEAAASGLLAAAADGFREHNAGVTESERWDIPAELDAHQIAALVLKFHTVCLLPWPTVWPDEPDTARDHCRLHVYQEHGMDAGLYTTDILSVIEAFVPEVDLFTEQDVEDLLRDSAEVRERQDPEDFVAVDEGILNSRTGEISAFSPEYVFTKRSQYEYGEWMLTWRKPRTSECRAAAGSRLPRMMPRSRMAPGYGCGME